MTRQHTDQAIRISDESHRDRLPLEARKRLWEQIWNRLLAPIDEETAPPDAGLESERDSQLNEGAVDDAA